MGSDERCAMSDERRVTTGEGGSVAQAFQPAGSGDFPVASHIPAKQREAGMPPSPLSGQPASHLGAGTDEKSKLVDALLGWFRRNARDLPWRRTCDPYGIWVSEVMLQQTRVKTVVAYWARWMHALPNIVALANAKPERVHKLWEGLGYYTRVRNMQQAARIIMEKLTARFPENFEEMMALPGIGRYTAGAICSIAFNQAKPILDGNVIRVLTRLFGIAENPHEKEANARLWRIAEELVIAAAKAPRRPARRCPRKRNRSARDCDYEGNEESETQKRNVEARPGMAAASQALRITRDDFRPCSHFNQSLMEVGALICTPRAPQCGICPVAKHCIGYREGRVYALPNLTRRPRVTQRHFVAFVAQKRGRFLVRQRPGGVVNAQLWEFPNLELRRGDLGVRLAAQASDTKGTLRLRRWQSSSDLKHTAQWLLGSTPAALEPLCTIKHSITRYRMTLEVFLVIGNMLFSTPSARGRWLTMQEMQRLPFAGAHKRIRGILQEQKRSADR